ncbi:MAG: hypothetical protein AABZ44_08070 [Elusimicrobiota bacterium]
MRLRCRKGQIILPSLMIFPSLALFAILIAELAKLSQQKVLMQFAMDTAVFHEASQLSDVANRLAYLNAPWPQRIFQKCGDMFDVTIGGPEPTGKLWAYLRKNGAFPTSFHHDECISGDIPAEVGNPWQGGFADANTDPEKAGPDSALIAARKSLGTMSKPNKDLGTIILFSEKDINSETGFGTLDWEEAMLYYQMFYEIYGYFYRLARMVTLVYDQLHGVFFEKTFWLNTGFKTKRDILPSKVKIDEHCSSKVKLWYTKATESAFGSIPNLYNNADEITPAQCSGGSSGLYQLSILNDPGFTNKNGIKTMKFGKHYYQGPPNHFGVDYKDLFDGEQPYISATAEVSGGSVWPDSKPQYQVRLRP